MTGCSMAAKRMGNDLITGKKKINDVSNAMNTASTSTKAFGVAMNVFMNVGFMLVITAITKVISELAQAQENAIQTAKEATEAYNEEVDSIDEYKKKLSELHKELNSGNLSYEETKTKRTELMSIQDELIEKFGTEKGAIESVTEAIKGQVDALDGLNEKAYRDWVAKADEETIWTKLLPGGKSGLDQAIDYMETEQTVSFYDMQNANLSKELQAIQTEIDETIKAKYNLDKTFAMFNVTGTPEEIKSQLESIRQDYLDLSKEAFLKNGISSELWEDYRKEAIDSINEVINKFDDGLEKHKETYQTYIEGMIKYDSEYSDEYANILQKRAELETAENSGNEDDIKNARQAFMDAISDGIEESSSNENIKKYFESLYPELQFEFASWNFEFAIDANTDSLGNIANEIGEKYKATDLLGMLDDDSAIIADSAFNSLIDKAIEYGICTDKSADEVKKLIDLLVELGYVQGEVQGSTLDNETTIFSLSEEQSEAIDNFHSKINTLSNALEKELTKTLTDADLSKLLQEFPELTDETDNLTVALQELIENQLSSLLNTLGSDIPESLTQSLKGSANEAIYFAGNVEKLQNDVKILITVLEDVKAGNEYNSEQMAELINRYGELDKAVIELTNGGYSIEEETLKDLINSKIEESNIAISAQIEMTEKTIENIQKRISAYEAESTALIALSSTMGKMYSQYDKMSVEEIMRTGQGRMDLIEAYGEDAVLAYEAWTANQAELLASQDKLKELKEQLKDSFKENKSWQKENVYDSVSKNSSKKTKETFDWIETLLSRIQRRIANLEKTVSSTFKNWSARNNALTNELRLVNEEISVQQSAYTTYMNKANSIGLSEHYKDLVMNGGLKIEDISDDTLKEQIDDFKNYYEKALKCSDAVEDLRENIADLASTKFQNIMSKYDEELSQIEHRINILDEFINRSETSGYLASQAYYQELSTNQLNNIKLLENEYYSLTNSFNEAVKTNAIEKYSEDWYEMLNNINDIEEALQSATTQLIEYNKSMRQISWDAFDRIQDYTNNINNETDFLIDLIDYYDLFDDVGNLTKYGSSVQGLHAVNYNVYMEQAAMYADEIIKIEKNMAENPYDMELVDRRNELLELQQSAILNAQNEKEAIRDLILDAYDKMLESLDNLIQKRKDALQSAKDLYDYEHSISEKTFSIASYQKQLEAYAGDNSEEVKATIQKLQVELANAKDDLEEAEYNKWLSDQQQLLDDFAVETELWVNQRIDNIDGLILEAVTATNNNTTEISETIDNVTSAHGYKLSDKMDEIWTDQKDSINGISNVVGVYGDVLYGIMNTTNGDLNAAKDVINNTIGGAGLTIGAYIDENGKVVSTTMSNGMLLLDNDLLSLGHSNNLVNNSIMNGTTSVNSALGNIKLEMTNMITALNEFAKANANNIDSLQNAVINSQKSNSNTTTTNNSQTNNSNSNNSSQNTGSAPNQSSNSNNNGNGSSSKPTTKTYSLRDNSTKTLLTTGTDSECKKWMTSHNYSEVSRSNDVIYAKYNGLVGKYKLIDKNGNVVESGLSKAEAQGKMNAYGNARGYRMQAYAKGTQNAKRGNSIVGEAGAEIIIRKDGSALLVSEPQMINLRGGETILNNDDTIKALKNSPINIDQIFGGAIKTPTLPKYKTETGTVLNDIQMNVAVKANDYNEFVSSLRTAIKNDSQCQKLVQSVTLDRVMGKNSLLKNKY